MHRHSAVEFPRLFHLLISLLSLLASLLAPTIGLAAPRGQIVAIDNSVFVAMVYPTIGKCICIQEKENWCWAACLRMIFQYNGINKTQSEIVRLVYGTPCDRTASGNKIQATFNGWNGFSVRSFKSKSAQSFINEIADGHPMLIGYGVHAYLLTHIYYRKTSNGGLTPFKVIMINPFLGKEEVFDWEEFYDNLNTIVTVFR